MESDKVVSSVNLFDRFSTKTTDDRSLFYNPEAPYSETEFQEIKNALDKCKKKSSNTKIKSLNRLINYCNDATDFTLLIDMLPNWIYLFSTLTKYDTEKSVRETTFRTQIAFFSKFKKQFARYLDEIFTPLWLGRCDPHREVAEAARKAFSIAFPEDRQPKVVEKCFERYIRESLSILRGDIQEKEEISERLMSCAFLGVKEAIEIAPEVIPQVAPLYTQFPVWSFTGATYPPLARSGSLVCFNSFLNKGILDREHYLKALPFLFSLIKDKNRLVQQALWGDAFINFLSKFPEFTQHIDINATLKDLYQCLRNGAFGAGPIFYPQLVKFLSLVGKEKLSGKKVVENLLLAILKGFDSEEGNFHGKFILNAYYEVIVFICIKMPDAVADIEKFILEPANMYLQSQSLITPIMHLNVVPGLLSQTLGYLEQRGMYPDISQYLYQLSYKGLEHSSHVAVAFLKELCHELNAKGLQCKTLVRNLIHIIHSQLSQEIDNKFTIGDINQLKNKIQLLLAFSGLSKVYLTFEPQIFEWWLKATSENLDFEVVLQLANLLQSNPNQWYRAFCNSKTSVKELSILLPDAELSELSKVVQVDQLQEILSELITNLKNAENLPTASGLIDLFYKLNICKFLSLVPLDTKIHRNIFMVLWLKEDDDLSLQEVVDTWKQAMIKESEGIDCCLICIKDTEMTNNTLPDISCHNCHNKYHSYCIDSLTENKDKCVYCSEKLE